jgi:hypothetical protein
MIGSEAIQIVAERPPPYAGSYKIATGPTRRLSDLTIPPESPSVAAPQRVIKNPVCVMVTSAVVLGLSVLNGAAADRPCVAAPIDAVGR